MVSSLSAGGSAPGAFAGGFAIPGQRLDLGGRGQSRDHLSRVWAGGRYQAELAVEPQGLLALLSGNRLDRFQTEMVYKDGRLTPQIYREETRRRGKYRLKEYRFDYDQGRLELWQHHQGKGLLRKWETTLPKEPIYDPLSAFYNFRLGALGTRQGRRDPQGRGHSLPPSGRNCD